MKLLYLREFNKYNRYILDHDGWLNFSLNFSRVHAAQQNIGK